MPLSHLDGRRVAQATALGHALHALTAMAGMQTGASMYRYYVAVDDDIDPVDLKQVIWAMCTRVDPAESIQILKSWTSDLDPRLPPDKRDQGRFHHEPNAHRRLQALCLARSLSDVQQVQRRKKKRNCR